MAQIQKSINAAMGGALNPTQVSQASSFFSSEYASQASREVPGDQTYDITSGRLGSAVRETPSYRSGGPVVPRLNAQYQMVRDFRPIYNTTAHNDQDVPYITDSLTMAGTKMRGATRDSQYDTTPSGQYDRIDDKIDPIMKCAPGEQKMFRGSSDGPSMKVQSIPEAYFNTNRLNASSNLVGLSAGDPSHHNFSSAYTPKVSSRFNSSAPLSQSPFSSPYTSLSPASFSTQGLNIP